MGFQEEGQLPALAPGSMGGPWAGMLWLCLPLSPCQPCKRAGSPAGASLTAACPCLGCGEC